MAQNTQLVILLFLCLERSLKHIKQSHNSCWMNGWMDKTMNKWSIPVNCTFFQTEFKYHFLWEAASISSDTHQSQIACA